jgi:hypothetical protein
MRERAAASTGIAGAPAAPRWRNAQYRQHPAGDIPAARPLSVPDRRWVSEQT